MLTLRARRDPTPPLEKDGRLVLETEKEWVVEGPRLELASFVERLPEFTERLSEGVALLTFRQSVGRFELPYIGEVELVSEKWTEEEFDRMLRELTEIAAALPFSRRLESGLPYERTFLPQRPVPYHAFVYLRYVLSDRAPGHDRLVESLGRIVASPNRKLVTSGRLIPFDQAGAVSASGLTRILASPWEWQRATSLNAFAQALGGYFPERVEEDRRRHSVDTPENRFVLAFLDLCRGVIERTRKHAEIQWKDDVLRKHVLNDCDRMTRTLAPIRSHALFRDVGPMLQFPAASTVLQRRWGYREVLQHFVRMRLVSRIPFDDQSLEDLLGLKDIATLYEIWCFFAVVRALEDSLGPARAAQTARVEVGESEVRVPWKVRVAWLDGTEVLYNATYSRGSAERKSTSVPLRPDISLLVPSGPNRGLHLLDAKFRLRSMDTETEDEDATSYLRADLYKMHAYRDAIRGARSVHILYPGSLDTFFPAEGVPGGGVGVRRAVPGDSRLHQLIESLLGRNPGG